MKLSFILFVCMVICTIGCTQRKPIDQVIVYTSLDQNFSEPILEDFENISGIKVKAVYDVEATKTTGLVNRLIAEKDNPQADVFWNSEIVRTIVLKNKGILAPYFSPSSEDIPLRFKDPKGYWTGFAARARALIYNTNLLTQDQVPESIFDLTQPQWRGRFCIAYPLFGTTATHCASLFVVLGDEKAKEYFHALKKNNVVIVDGNSTSRDRVVMGEFHIGFTDTDDVNVAMGKGNPVDMIFPDKDGIGTLLIPNTIALIRNGPNPENGKRFIDYILSKEVESRLAFSGSLQIPLRPDVPKPKRSPGYTDIKLMDVDFEAVADKMEEVCRFLQELFVR